MICEALCVPFYVSKRNLAASMFLLYISGFLTHLWSSLYTAIISREGDKPALPYLLATKILLYNAPSPPPPSHTPWRRSLTR